MTHWSEIIATRIIKSARRYKGKNPTIVCASGITPSGPVHLGNLRELMTVHLVTESLRAKGVPAKHIHSWDDYDRFRKVPVGVPSVFEEHIGKPLSEVPDPWNEYASFADRFVQKFVSSIEKMGIRDVVHIRQSQAYKAGKYVKEIETAMKRRFEIFDILAQFQTDALHDEPASERRRKYYPFRVYCEQCKTDNTSILRYEYETSLVSYCCSKCNNESSFRIREKASGKLVWKVDWPMRWNYEQVDFEPGGEDHSAPGSSFSAGREIVKKIYNYRPPDYVEYAFIGMGGDAKISSSAGTTGTPENALKIFEPSILRWLYVRKRPRQAFNISFGKDIYRFYDEWDTFSKQNQSDSVYKLSTSTSSCPNLIKTETPVSFRLISSAADITQGNRRQILRVLDESLTQPVMEEDIEPRLSCAIEWALEFQPDQERTTILKDFNQNAYDSFSDAQKEAVFMLSSRMHRNWSHKGLTELVYTIPKIQLGLSEDIPPTPELKNKQRDFFKSVYQMLCGNYTGPRLPTLLLSVGKETANKLLTSKHGSNRVADQ